MFEREEEEHLVALQRSAEGPTGAVLAFFATAITTGVGKPVVGVKLVVAGVVIDGTVKIVGATAAAHYDLGAW